ncbi:hypothetical protein PEL8287_02835 [Roseovarius litorisediminis]|uniref:DUF4864 domain-containing protein n=1 Tax=Roseovarius litorisediminis TaxID=1312363 RepID=A0A1Y5T3F4_9RHOB|nr:DUF4864 domain-containing protein [Roseovarius litorisediminis]SLN53141.1 hypothetical protein PEL8287_02835 [Roseovarius litorisediminis]
MRRGLYTLMLMGCLALPARADETAIRQVISDQITAFLADDFEAAFDFASPSIRSIFRTPENFGAMVRDGYPMVWRPAEVDFLKAETIAGQLWQNVMVRDADGVLHILEYQMVEGDDGWKINAVRVRKAPAGAV